MEKGARTRMSCFPKKNWEKRISVYRTTNGAALIPVTGACSCMGAKEKREVIQFIDHFRAS